MIKTKSRINRKLYNTLQCQSMILQGKKLLASGGMTAVTGYSNQLKLNTHDCLTCEGETPTIETVVAKFCLACGQEKDL